MSGSVDSAGKAALSSGEDTRIAAIDIGSNSVRLVVAQVLPGGGYRILNEERENTRLASVLASTGRLDTTAMNQTLAALRNFLTIAQGFGAREVRAIATSAIREAVNGRAFCERIQAELQLKVEVIAPREEARLAFLSVTRAFDVANREVAVADIGGGSTEIVLASSGLVEQVYATNLGAVRLAEQCKVTSTCEEKGLIRLQRTIDRELKRKIGKPPFVPAMLFGTGGTFTSLASMILARLRRAKEPLRGFRTTRADIHHLIADLSHLSLEKRHEVAGLNPKRADIIVPGLAIIERVMRYLKINVLQVHTRGVRDGLLLTMIQGTPSKPMSPVEQRKAVERFAGNCGVDLEHANQVARIAGELWHQLAEPLKLSHQDRPLIETAALLANVGYLINFDNHHKHSYHLIQNSELPGFERHQLQILANVARYHRGASPKQKHNHFRELTNNDQLRVSQIAAILRLALALDRTHQQRIAGVTANDCKGTVEITIFAKENPEVDLWAARRKVKLFENVFHRQVVFSTSQSFTPNQPDVNDTKFPSSEDPETA